jgi:heme/copper-type cytochrome/quinol oxidase subunit 2
MAVLRKVRHNITVPWFGIRIDAIPGLTETRFKATHESDVRATNPVSTCSG